jgi:hypothetical protein
MAFDVTKYGNFPAAQSAEVIAERPTVNNSYTDLANFGTLYIDGSAAAEDGNTEIPFGQFPQNLDTTTGLWRHGVHMVSSTTGRDLADPSDIASDGSFSIRQNNCN